MSATICSLGKYGSTSFIETITAILLKISSDKNFFHMQQTNKLAKRNKEYTDERELIEVRFENDIKGMDATSAEYVARKNEELRELQKADNDYNMDAQTINNDTDRKINPLDTEQEMWQTLLANARAQRDMWKESEQKCIEDEYGCLGNNT